MSAPGSPRCPRCGGTSGYFVKDHGIYVQFSDGSWNGYEYGDHTGHFRITYRAKTVVCYDCKKRIPRPPSGEQNDE